MQPYTEDFYNLIDDSALRSAKEIVPLVMKLIQPKRVVDVGCGLGTWLSVFQEYGVEEILGIDGDYVDGKMLKIPPEYFVRHDLVKPLKIEQYFDLVVSLEVAEHLPQENAEQFVDTLVSLGSVILFSAAVPYQPGTCHLNGQWPNYWINNFHKKGYVVIDLLRDKVWQNKKVEWWYSQNIFLFIKESLLENYPLLKQELNEENMTPPSLVHPKLYVLQQSAYQTLQESFKPNNMSVKQAGSLFMLVLKNALKRRINKTFVKK
jgi:SAM-dependent methyltransferase